MSQGTGTFKVKSWDEKPLLEAEGETKVNHASVAQSLSGVIEGESQIEYVIAYPSTTYALFVGIQKVSGRIDGKAGTFGLEVRGTWEGATAGGTLAVVPSSGTGALSGLSGRGTYQSTGPQDGTITFEYKLD
jgi:Protein of unknown function (DUF3224)